MSNVPTVSLAEILTYGEVRVNVHAAQVGLIYFILEDGPEKLIKIGYTTDIKKRMQQLQSGNPRKFQLLAWMRGPQAVEALLHRIFKNYRVNQEWFQPGAELVDLILDVQAYENRPFSNKWVSDNEVARHFGMGLRDWREWYKGNPELRALAFDFNGAYYWQISKVSEYLRRPK